MQSPRSKPISLRSKRCTFCATTHPCRRLLQRGDAMRPADSHAIVGLELALQRTRMVREQLALRGITDDRVLAVFRAVPREEFVPDPLKSRAYDDTPLPIGADRTISQPYI